MDLREMARLIDSLPPGPERSGLRDMLEAVASRELEALHRRWLAMATDETSDRGKLEELVRQAAKREALLTILAGAPQPPRRTFAQGLRRLFGGGL